MTKKTRKRKHFQLVQSTSQLEKEKRKFYKLAHFVTNLISLSIPNFNDGKKESIFKPVFPTQLVKDYSKVCSLSPLRYLTKLEGLNLEYCSKTSLKNLMKHKNLITLQIEFIKLDDLQIILEIQPSLQYLSINEIFIKEMKEVLKFKEYLPKAQLISFKGFLAYNTSQNSEIFLEAFYQYITLKEFQLLTQYSNFSISKYFDLIKDLPNISHISIDLNHYQFLDLEIMAGMIKNKTKISRITFYSETRFFLPEEIYLFDLPQIQEINFSSPVLMEFSFWDRFSLKHLINLPNRIFKIETAEELNLFISKYPNSSIYIPKSKLADEVKDKLSQIKGNIYFEFYHAYPNVKNQFLLNCSDPPPSLEWIQSISQNKKIYISMNFKDPDEFKFSTFNSLGLRKLSLNISKFYPKQLSKILDLHKKVHLKLKMNYSNMEKSNEFLSQITYHFEEISLSGYLHQDQYQSCFQGLQNNSNVGKFKFISKEKLCLDPLIKYLQCKNNIKKLLIFHSMEKYSILQPFIKTIYLFASKQPQLKTFILKRVAREFSFYSNNF